MLQILVDAQGRRYVPTPYGFFYIREQPGLTLARPRGMGDLSGMEYVTWRANSYLPLSDLFSAGTWNGAQTKLGNLMAQRGWSVVRVGWEVANYIPLSYNLVVTAYLPQGIDGAESVIADLAEAAGFSIDRSTINFHAGGTPSPGDGTTPKDKDKQDWTPFYIGGAALLLVLLLRG
jgi:hypothetical protein